MIQDEAFWESKRRLIPREPGKINLNAGTLSPTPLPVLDAVTRLRHRQASEPSDFIWRQAPRLIQRARARLAEYLNCDASDLLLLENTTYAINLIVNSLKFPAGIEILTTDHEYGAMMLCWRRAAEQNGWSIRPIQLPFRTEDPLEVVQSFTSGISASTRALYFSHVTTTTGLVLPARQLCELARQRGLISIVDGAHAPGMIPLNLINLDADFYTGNCHKWMMAPAGAGFLHVAPSHKSLLKPLITSWGYDYDRSQPEKDSGWGGTDWQWDLEFHGTVDRCPQMVIPEALDWRDEIGGDRSIEARVRTLSDYARRKLIDCGLDCATPQNPLLHASMMAFDYPCDDPVQFRDRLWREFHIECPVTVADGRNFLRVSTAWFNTTDEIDTLADTLMKIRSGSPHAQTRG